MSIKIIENKGIDSEKDSIFDISDGSYKCISCQKEIPEGETVIGCYCYWGDPLVYCEDCALEDPNSKEKYCREFCDMRMLSTNCKMKIHKLLIYAEVLKQLIRDGSTFEIGGIVYTATSTTNIKTARK